MVNSIGEAIMTKNVLISTLGESPAVVTEALDILSGRRITIHEVILLTTTDHDAKDSLDLLREHIFAYSDYYNIKNVNPIQIGAYDDINSEGAVIEFMETACDQLRDMRKRGWDVYVSIAGGRKTMSALMTLAVQIYGAKELFHIIVDDPELERKSRIDKLLHYNEKEQKDILHPDISKITCISMPFIGLFPWITDIVKTLKGETEDRGEIKELLCSNGLIEDNNPTILGKRFLDILERVESMPEPCIEESKIILSKGEPRYKKEIEKMAQRLRQRFSFICEIRDADWRRGEPKVKKQSPNKLKIYYPSRKGFNLSLLLTTTAKTSGQLETCKREVEKILGREL
jgi:CRISPR-associated protein Csx14